MGLRLTFSVSIIYKRGIVECTRLFIETAGKWKDKISDDACLSFFLRLLTCSRLSFQPLNLRFKRDPASKIPLLVFKLTKTSTSKLSYLRYIFNIFLSSSITKFPRPPKKVENTLFKVLRNGFNVSGTPFEAMFALPQAQTDDNIQVEGLSLENPIHLPGVKVDHFRSFLRILYPLCVFDDSLIHVLNMI